MSLDGERRKQHRERNHGRLERSEIHIRKKTSKKKRTTRRKKKK